MYSQRGDTVVSILVGGTEMKRWWLPFISGMVCFTFVSLLLPHTPYWIQLLLAWTLALFTYFGFVRRIFNE